MNSGEARLIRWLEERKDDGFQIEDMSSVELGGQEILLSSDMVLEGAHFDSPAHDLEGVGRKALLACLSDCAAMAVNPLAALVSLALPKGKVFEVGQSLLTGMMAAAKPFKCLLVGGDTTSWNGPIAIDVAVVARPWNGCRPVRRAGARPGDIVAVTGSFGGSILRKQLCFTPRIEEARQLAELLGQDLHAMIDVSDGLALDLSRICAASGCGALLDERSLQKIISPDAVMLSERDGRPPLEHALSDGEDYELIFAASRNSRHLLDTLHIDWHVIGSFTNMKGGLQMRRLDDSEVDLEPRGFEH